MAQNNAKIKYNMMERVSDWVDSLLYSIESMEKELSTATEKQPEERDWSDDNAINNYPCRIEAFRRLISILEKI